MPEPQSIWSEYQILINDFSCALKRLKNNGMSHLDISGETIKTIKTLPDCLDAKIDPINSRGPEDAEIIIIDGESVFFQGEAGLLLEKILAAMSLSKDRVFICNAPDRSSLVTKMSALNPKVIIALGDAAAQMMLATQKPVSLLCGRFHSFGRATVMCTHHPLELLTRPDLKRQVWEDMKMVMAALGLPTGA